MSCFVTAAGPARQGTALYQATLAGPHGQHDSHTTGLLVVEQRFKPSHTTVPGLNGLLFCSCRGRMEIFQPPLQNIKLGTVPRFGGRR